MNRKYYIDNLRWMAILLLFPFHAMQIWSGGEYSGFYIWSHTNNTMYALSTADAVRSAQTNTLCPDNVWDRQVVMVFRSVHIGPNHKAAASLIICLHQIFDYRRQHSGHLKNL